MKMTEGQAWRLIRPVLRDVADATFGANGNGHGHGRPGDRLKRIAGVIETVDQRCLAVDGPVPKTRELITDDELREIYRLAGGKPARA